MQPFIEQPQFLAEPQSTFLFDSQPVRLECRAIRTRQIFFNCDQKWLPESEHKKSTTINDKSQLIVVTSIELKSDDIDANQKYKCFCQAWSATGGTLKSRTATIEVAYLEKIFEWEPIRTDGVIGKSTEFRCRPPLGHPYPKVTWFKDNRPVEINRNGRLILSNENSLLIASIEKSDAGNYTCVASNIAGSYSSEPAELIVHEDRGWSDWQPFSDCKGIPCTTGRQRRIRTCLNPPTINNRPSCDGDQIQERECPVPCPDDSSTTEEFSSWSSWSNCTGTPCQIGRQHRRRNCLKTSICTDGETQERDCRVPCEKGQSSKGIYSNWTDWSLCQSPECVSTRTRRCLLEYCPDDLIESRRCENSPCSNIHKTNSDNMTFNFSWFVYLSAFIGILSLFLVAVLCIRGYNRHSKRRNRKTPSLSNCITSKTSTSDCQIERSDYPFYYSIQHDNSSTKSSSSQNNSTSLYHCSPLNFQGTMRFNRNYKKIIESLPNESDLRFLSVSLLNNRGCRLEIAQTGVSLIVPEDAVLPDEEHFIYVVLLDSIFGHEQKRLSPIVLVGPPDITLLKPAVLSFEHSTKIENSFSNIELVHTENFLEWKSILKLNEENFVSPVHLELGRENKAFLMFETMGAYCLIGKSTPIELQVACFYSPSMLHVRVFPRTSDSFERCLTEEYANNNFLCDEPKLFVFHDDEDRISLNIDYELSPMTRIHVGFEQISFENLSNGFFERPSFHFELPDFQLNSQVSFAVHVDLYQSKHLDDAFHARLLIDPIRIVNNTAYNTLSRFHRQRSKSNEKVNKLPNNVRKILCQMLDQPNILGNDWRLLANNLLGIDRLQYFATKTSPTEHLLTLWQSRQESLVNLINVLNQIGRSDAACLILSHVNISP